MAADSNTPLHIPNPALAPFTQLIGEWETSGNHPQLPGKPLKGNASFKWIEQGAFLVWYSEVHEKEFPNGTAVFASDDSTGEFFILYFDSRKVSRKYNVSVEGNVIKWWRNDPKFSQRCTWTISEDGNTIVSKGEMSKNGKSWEGDLSQTFVKKFVANG